MKTRTVYVIAELETDEPLPTIKANFKDTFFGQVRRIVLDVADSSKKPKSATSLKKLLVK